METPTPLRFLPILVRRVWLQALVLCLLLVGHVGLDFFPKAKEHPSIAKTISFLAVWVVAWGLSRILQALREMPSIASRLAPDLRGITFALLRAMIYGLSFLVALDTIGISITPLIASLGVGSIAVGLALQDTLGNLISGAYLYLDRPVAVGDWIRLDNGLEGQVARIGWRTTRIVAIDNMVVIPNSKLSTAMVTNLNLPSSDQAVSVKIGVGYGSDLEKVERTLLDIGREFYERFPDGLRERAPVVRFQEFGDSSIQVCLIVRVKGYGEQVPARHELIKLIKARFDRENIEIPFPQRVIRQA